MRLVFSTQDIPEQLMESMLHPPIRAPNPYSIQPMPRAGPNQGGTVTGGNFARYPLRISLRV